MSLSNIIKRCRRWTKHGRMGTTVRNNLTSSRRKKFSKVRVQSTTLKNWVENGPISGRSCLLDEPASQCYARIYIHVHNLFSWCNHNIPELLIFTYSATPYLWASFPFFHGGPSLRCANGQYIVVVIVFSTREHSHLQVVEQGDSSNVYICKVSSFRMAICCVWRRLARQTSPVKYLMRKSK